MQLPELLSGSRIRYLVWLIVNGSAQAAIVIAMALMMQSAFDSLISTASAPGDGTLFEYLGGFALIVVCNAALRWRERVDAEKLGQDYVFELRQQLFAHMSRLSPRSLQRRSQGATMLRFIGDMNALRQWISLGVARLAVAAITTALTLLVLGILNPAVALLIALLMLGAVATMLGLGRALEHASRDARRQRSRLSSNINEKIGALAVVQALGQRQRERRLLKKHCHRLQNAMLHRASLIGQLRAVTETVVGLATSGIILLGAWQVSTGNATAGTVISGVMVVGMLAPALRDLGRVHEYWRGARVAREKLLQFLQAKGRIWQPRGAPDLKIRHGAIKFERVSVGDSIHDFSRRADGGQRIALLGPNGSGKSTLLGLVSRLQDPDQGRVLIDGQNIAMCSLESLRANIGMVGPDLPLLRGSIERNLRYRYPHASAEQLLEVMQLCGVDEMVAGMARGLRTRISEGGRNLSAGQRARLALARALLGAPPILLLDEADANLDSESENLIQRVLQDYRGTILIVSHRYPRLVKMDQVWHLGTTETERSEQSPASLPVSRTERALAAVN
ncbi:MAG: ABC transporter ATP-binding protein/permease [Gammaproteobacteria bacterium]|nr:ABC transporter ATP-binding protein/permease [Gammaproteobacteria bacterium]